MFLSHLFHYQDCLLCGAAAPDSHSILCGLCSASLPLQPELACTQCAVPGSGSLCGACLSVPPQFDVTLAAFSYAFPLDRLIQSFKFNANFALLDLLADACDARLAHAALPRA